MQDLFVIYQVDSDEAARIAENPNAPHTHTYEELMIGSAGALEHFIDFESVTTRAPFVSFVTKGKVHRVYPKAVDGQCAIWVIRFKSEFIAETTFQLYAWYHNQADLNLEAGPCFDRLLTVCELMAAEMRQETPDYAIIRQLLSALFTMVEGERKKIHPETDYAHNTKHISFKNFLAVLEENYRRPVGVEYYAEKLFMSSRNLNLICQDILSQSVSEIIETRKLIEAKNLLISTDKTVSEIAYELGYSDNAYFSNVFKKKSGESPGAFRKEMQAKLIS